MSEFETPRNRNNQETPQGRSCVASNSKHASQNQSAAFPDGCQKYRIDQINAAQKNIDTKSGMCPVPGKQPHITNTRQPGTEDCLLTMNGQPLPSKDSLLLITASAEEIKKNEGMQQLMSLMKDEELEKLFRQRLRYRQQEISAQSLAAEKESLQIPFDTSLFGPDELEKLPEPNQPDKPPEPASIVGFNNAPNT